MDAQQYRKSRGLTGAAGAMPMQPQAPMAPQGNEIPQATPDKVAGLASALSGGASAGALPQPQTPPQMPMEMSAPAGAPMQNAPIEGMQLMDPNMEKRPGFSSPYANAGFMMPQEAEGQDQGIAHLGAMPQDPGMGEGPIPGHQELPGDPPPEEVPIFQQIESGLSSNDPQLTIQAVSNFGNLTEGHIPADSVPGQLLRYANTNFLQGKDPQGGNIYTCPLTEQACSKQTFWQRLASYLQVEMGQKDEVQAAIEAQDLNAMDPVAMASSQGQVASTTNPYANKFSNSSAPAYQAATPNTQQPL